MSNSQNEHYKKPEKGASLSAKDGVNKAIIEILKKSKTSPFLTKQILSHL